MKYAFFPGCVSRGGCPELYPAAVAVAEKLGLELEEMRGASCTGAGVMQEANLFLTDCLNARTFAQAQQMGLPIMNVPPGMWMNFIPVMGSMKGLYSSCFCFRKAYKCGSPSAYTPSISSSSRASSASGNLPAWISP